MRFCPFCAQENPDEGAECIHCGKRLPVQRAAPRPAPRPPRPAPPPPVAKPAPVAPAPAPAPVAPKPAPAPAAPAPAPAPVAPKPAPAPVAAPVPAPPAPRVAATGTLLGLPSPEPPARQPAPGPERVLAVAEPPPIVDEEITDRTPLADLDDEPPAEALPAPPSFEPTLAAPSMASPVNSDGAPPPLATAEPLPTPFLPTMALPPMPAAPSSASLVAAVRYLPPVARAVWARRRAQRTIGELLHGDQRLLDQALRDLGRAAREADLDAPLIADEMQLVRAQEDRRTQAQAAIADAQARLEKEHERWTDDERTRREAIARREDELKKTEEELKTTHEQRRAHDVERARVDGQIRAAEKRAAQETARAEKAEQTPVEKGGGATAAASARSAAETARKEASALIPARDEARAKAEALDAPLGALTKRVSDERAQLHDEKKQLGEATLAHKKTVATVELERHEADVDRAGAEREISQRFVSVGTLLNLNRVETAPFLPIYARIDELKGEVNAREETLARLETERNSYDRAVVQKGLLAFGVAVGGLALMVVILVVLLAR